MAQSRKHGSHAARHSAIGSSTRRRITVSFGHRVPFLFQLCKRSRKIPIAALALLSAAASASPASVAAWEQKMAPLARMAGQIEAVQVCRLRSPGWQDVMGSGLNQLIQQAHMPSFSDSESDEVSQWEKRTSDAAGIGIIGRHFEHCDHLRGSALMDRLDRLEWQWSGGYH